MNIPNDAILAIVAADQGWPEEYDQEQRAEIVRRITLDLQAAAPFMIRKAKADALRNYAAGLEMEAGPDARVLVKDVADDARSVADEIEEEA